MNPKNKITILSTFAEDKIISKNGALISKQDGGPAFYIKKAFEKEKMPFISNTGSKMNVQILVTKNGEFGKIPQKINPKKVAFSKIKTPFLIISSILNEFDLSDIPKFKGKVFLDIQGYVRNGDDFGKKKLWEPNKKVFENIFCLKGTEDELKNIPDEYLQSQKQKILLITKGKRGCEVFVFGKRYIAKLKKIIEANNTIGAGDNFFACFVIKFIKTGKILNSIKYATDKTSEFLSAISIHHNQLLREEIGCG